MATRLPTGARWPRSLLALFFASSAGALGLGALASGTAQAANDGTACGGPLQPFCGPTAPVITSSTTEFGGTITITWTAVGKGLTPNPGTPTLTWTPGVTNAPPGATPPSSAAVNLDNGTCGPGGQATLVCSYPWPPALLALHKYVVNGNYTVNAAATDCLIASVGACSGPTNGAGPVSVNNAAAPPGGVDAVVQSPPSSVKIKWTPNAEPDVTGYQVMRGDSANTVVCTVSMFPPPAEYSCIDSPPKDGSYTYHVVAYRWPPNYSTKISDQRASDPSLPTKAVTVSGTSANTTTTTAPGGTPPTLGPSGFKPTPGRLGAGIGGGIGAGGVFHSTPGTRPALSGDNPANASDPGFQPLLPYGQASTTIAGDPTALSAPPVAPHKGKTSVGTIAVIGAGLLVAVIALHGLWLRAEVRRPTPLEALDPEA